MIVLRICPDSGNFWESGLSPRGDYVMLIFFNNLEYIELTETLIFYIFQNKSTHPDV